METNLRMRKIIFEILENQIRNNDPAETKITRDRLIKEGYNEFQAKQLIAQCLTVEIFDIMKFKKPFLLERYIKNLKALPKEPFED